VFFNLKCFGDIFSDLYFHLLHQHIKIIKKKSEKVSNRMREKHVVSEK